MSNSYTFGCPGCRGTGFHEYGMCVDCGGTGRMESSGGMPYAPRDEMGCPGCRGTGFHEHGMCVDCGGTGRIKMR